MREEGVNPLWVRLANEFQEARLANEIAIDLIQEGFEAREILDPLPDQSLPR